MNQNIHRTSTLGMSREDWLLERKKSLGGSDIGAILGLNHYSSPYSVWAEKTGKTADKPDNEAMRQGRDLEDYVCRRFMEVSGLKVQRCNAILRNDAFPHLHANVDRLIVGQKAGVEAKTASALNASKFAAGEFPGSYYAQCVAYLAVTEYERWYLAAVILGKGFVVYQMTRIPEDTCPDWCESSVFVSEEEIRALGDAAKRFWEDYVEKDTPPAVDGSKATAEALTEVIGRSDDERYADLTLVSGKIKLYLEAKSRAAEYEEIAERNASEIKQFMGTASKGGAEGVSVSWRTQGRKSFDVKRFTKEHPEIDISGYYNHSTTRPFKVTVNQ
jgi:putative phage-type endonuclease